VVVAFTGIRDIDPSMQDEVEMAVLDTIDAGATELRFGGALGLDTMALEAAWRMDSLRASAVRHIPRVVYVPFDVDAQPKVARDAIRECASSVVEIGLKRGLRNAYLIRNDRMIEDADLVVGFTDGRTAGGTAYTMAKARSAGIDVVTIQVAATQLRRNPKIEGVQLTAPLYALQEYVSADVAKHWLSEFVRRNKVGRVTGPGIGRVVQMLVDLIQKNPDLSSCDTIVAMPRRVPGKTSDMQTIAKQLADRLDLTVCSLTRIEEPAGGVVKARRVRFPADEHARTMHYVPAQAIGDGARVIVLDNVVTTGATLNGAFAAVRLTNAEPVGLTLLYSTAFGGHPVQI